MLGGAALADASPGGLTTPASSSSEATCCMGWHCCARTVTLLVMASTVSSRLLPSSDSSAVAIRTVVGTVNLQMVPPVGVAQLANRPLMISLWAALQMQEAVPMPQKSCSAARACLGCCDLTLMRSSRGTCGSRPAGALRSRDGCASAAAAAAGGGAADPPGSCAAVTFTWPGWLRGRAALPWSAQKPRRQIVRRILLL